MKDRQRHIQRKTDKEIERQRVRETDRKKDRDRVEKKLCLGTKKDREKEVRNTDHEIERHS